MKRKLLYLFTFFYYCFLQAQTNVSGTLTSDTTWNKNGSPYILTSTIGIFDGVTLTVEAGVEIQGDFDLLVKGIILLQGNSNEKVTFRNTRLIFKETNLSNSVVNYANFLDNSGVQLANEAEHNQDPVKNTGTLTINDSDFKLNAYARTKGYGTTAKLKLVNCNFEDALVKGFYPRSESIELENAKIKRSVINSDSYNLGITLTNSLIEDSEFTLGCCGANINLESCEVKKSLFKDYNNYYKVKINNSVLTETLLRLNSGELEVSNSLLSIPENSNDFHILARNVNLSNVIFNGNGRGNAINVLSRDFTSRIQNCTFKNYKKAIGLNESYNSSYLRREELEKKEKLAKQEERTVFNFTFKNNNMIDIEDYNFVNKFNSNIDATQNYWGTSDQNTIQNKIFDGLDDINYGIVDFSNYLPSPTNGAPISKPKKVFKGKKEEGIMITWQANEEADLAGYKVYYKQSGSNNFMLLSDVGNVTSYTTDEIIVDAIIAVKAYTTDADGINDFREGDESSFSEVAKDIINNASVTSSSLCGDENLNFNFDSEFSFVNNEFVLQLSDINGDFTTPTELGRVSSSNENFSVVVPESMIKGEHYFIRILATELGVISKQIEIVSYEEITSSFEVSDISLCSEDTVTVTYTGNASDDAIYNWSFSGATVVSGSGAGPYELKWQNSGEKQISLEVSKNDCSSLTEQTININQKPTASFIMNNSACGGETVTIRYNGNALNNAVFNWDFDGATVISGSGVGPYQVTWNESYGEKNVTLTVTENECVSDEVTKVISHTPTPQATIQIDNEICSGTTATVTFTGTASNNAVFNWNFNGATIVSGSDSGPYELRWYGTGERTVSLEVRDNGCSSYTQKTVTINRVPTAYFYVNNSNVCSGQTVNVYYYGTTVPGAEFNWDFDGGTIVSGTGSGPYEISWEDNYGEKNISLYVTNNGCNSETRTQIVQYNQSPTLSFDADSSVCKNQNYTIEYTGEHYENVYWSFDGATIISGTGAGPYVLQWEESGEKNIFFQANNNGCTVYETINVTVQRELETPEICVVTVDDDTLKNKIIWNYESEEVSQFAIYKETTVAGEFTLISYVNPEENSYIDETSSPAQNASIYKIAAVDACGVETNLSNSHKTVHLVLSEGINSSWNMIWNDYEGLNFASYKIYRSIDNSDYELLTQVSSNLNSYTDIGVSSSNVSYFIEVVNTISCGVEISGRDERQTTNIISPKSNIASTKRVEGSLEEKIKVSPNPATDILNISLKDKDVKLSGYELYSTQGGLFKMNNAITRDFIDIKDLPAGIYFLKLNTEKGSVVKKIIKR